MNYSLTKVPGGKIQATLEYLVQDSTYNIVFLFDYENFHSWTKPEEFMDSSNIYTINSTHKNQELTDWDLIPADHKLLILSRMFSLIKDEYTKECEFMNHHYTGHINSSSYQDHKVNYNIANYPKVIKTFIDKAGETITLRQEGSRLKYVKKAPDGDILRNEDGSCVYLSDEEMTAKSLNFFETSVIAFNEKDESVALASDEFGADGIWVNEEYKARGIGLIILTEFRKQFSPNRKMGQMTNEGFALAKAYYRSEILKI